MDRFLLKRWKAIVALTLALNCVPIVAAIGTQLQMQKRASLEPTPSLPRECRAASVTTMPLRPQGIAP